MIRDLFTRKDIGHGFALPTVMIVSVVMMIILVTAVQASASVRTALSNQYYNNLASEAAEAGIMFAHACIQNQDGYASWNQLQPDTNCDGNGINGLPNGRYLIKKDGEMRTTFSVSSTSSVDADPYNLIVSGSVQLLRKSSPDNPWKTISIKKKLQVQPCSKTITNMISNPSFELNTNGWSAGGANIARSTNAAAPPTTDGSYTLLVQSTGTNESYAAIPAATIPLAPGKTYTVSGVIHIPAGGLNTSGAHARRASIAIFYINTPTGTYNEHLAKAPVTTAGYQRVSTTFTVPATVSSTDANNAFLRLYNGAVSGDVYWDSIMLTEGKQDYQFRDGDTPAWAWNGTFNNATSTGPVKTACTTASTCAPTNLITNPNFESPNPSTTNWVGANATPSADGTWKASGSNSMRITPTSSSGDSFASIGGDDGGLRLGMQAGKTYTVSATVNVPSLSGSVTYPWRRAGIVIHTWNPISGWSVYTVNPTGKHQFNGGELTNSPSNITAGTYKLSTTFTVPTNGVSAFIRMYNGGTSTAPVPIVQWDNVALYEGTRAPYYDGNSAGWAWSGELNLSTSSGPVVPCNAPISY